MSLSRSSECFHLEGSECLHPKIFRIVEASDCASCAHYRGPMRGLGDIVAAVTEATGVSRVVHAVAPDCGCAKRRAALNAAVPFSDQGETT